jgi:type IV secretion system protein VirB6/type IV secretion system protein TrbL
VSACGIIIATVILVILAMVGVNMLVLLVSGWILAYGGVFFLGFGGARWTSDMAINYYKTVLSVAAQLFVMVLIVGIGKTFLDDYYSSMGQKTSIKEMGVMLIVALILLMLVNKLPALVAGIITGASVGGAGIGQFGAGAALGAAGMATVAAAAGGAMLTSGLANIAGGASAIKAAFSQANENVASGTDVLTSMWGGGNAGSSGSDSSSNTPYAEAAGFANGSSSAALPGADGGKAEAEDAKGRGEGGDQAGGGQQADDSSDGSSKASDGAEKARQAEQQGGASDNEKPDGLLASAAKATGAAGKTAVDAGANLARGAAEVAKTKVAGFKKSAMERIGATTGGKIAAAIKAQGNSLSGERQADPESEVAAFRDRDSKLT